MRFTTTVKMAACSLGTILAALLVTAPSADAYLWEAPGGFVYDLTEHQMSNGHSYMVVDYVALGIQNKSWGHAAWHWDDNNDYHLATPQSQDENDFIWGLIETFPDINSSNPLSNNREYWLGGFYGSDGWYWVEEQGKFWDGSGGYGGGHLTEDQVVAAEAAWAADRIDGVYENWQYGERPWQSDYYVYEPSGDQDGYLAMWSLGGENDYNHMGWWNDEGNLGNIFGYVLESFDGYTPIPIPGSVILLASGVLGLMGLRRTRKGF